MMADLEEASAAARRGLDKAIARKAARQAASTGEVRHSSTTGEMSGGHADRHADQVKQPGEIAGAVNTQHVTKISANHLGRDFSKVQRKSANVVETGESLVHQTQPDSPTEVVETDASVVLHAVSDSPTYKDILMKKTKSQNIQIKGTNNTDLPDNFMAGTVHPGIQGADLPSYKNVLRGASVPKISTQNDGNIALAYSPQGGSPPI